MLSHLKNNRIYLWRDLIWLSLETLELFLFSYLPFCHGIKLLSRKILYAGNNKGLQFSWTLKGVGFGFVAYFAYLESRGVKIRLLEKPGRFFPRRRSEGSRGGEVRVVCTVTAAALTRGASYTSGRAVFAESINVREECTSRHLHQLTLMSHHHTLPWSGVQNLPLWKYPIQLLILLLPTSTAVNWNQFHFAMIVVKPFLHRYTISSILMSGWPGITQQQLLVAALGYSRHGLRGAYQFRSCNTLTGTACNM